MHELSPVASRRWACSAKTALSPPSSSSTWAGAPEAAHGSLVGPSWLVRRRRPTCRRRSQSGPRHEPGRVSDASRDGAPRSRGRRSRSTRRSARRWATAASAHVPRATRALRDVAAECRPTDRPVRARRSVHAGVRPALRRAQRQHAAMRPDPALRRDLRCRGRVRRRPGWEAHVTGFVHDPIQDAVEHGDGAAVVRRDATRRACVDRCRRSLRAQPRRRAHRGRRHREVLARPVRTCCSKPRARSSIRRSRPQRPAAKPGRQLPAGSWFVHDGWMLDLGLSQYDEDISVKALDIEAFDVNLHWFATSHWELLLTNRDPDDRVRLGRCDARVTRYSSSTIGCDHDRSAIGVECAVQCCSSRLRCKVPRSRDT